MSVHVDTQGTGKIDDAAICSLVKDVFPLSPGGIIKYLDLLRPIYTPTSVGGHFGRDIFPWESTAKAAELSEKAGALTA